MFNSPKMILVKEFREWIDSQSDFDPGLWFLAMDGEEIAGICLCKRNRTEYPGAAWVNVLGVRRPWRKQGLGLALLHHAFGVFYREGKERTGLGVDSSNLTGATRLYEKAGMSVVKQDDAYEKEVRPGRDAQVRSNRFARIRLLDAHAATKCLSHLSDPDGRNILRLCDSLHDQRRLSL